MKNKMMRLASLLMVAVLLTTSVVSGTYAKYVTTADAEETARVAKWGVTVTAGGSLFSKTYIDEPATGTGITVESSDEDKVVAPGTQNTTGLSFSITGKPEVTTQVSILIDNANSHDIQLDAGTYTDDPTTATVDDPVTVGEYHPLRFTLTQTKYASTGGATLPAEEFANLTFTELVAKLNGITKQYAPNTDLATVCGDYVITWTWGFGDPDNNVKDTLLGNLAATNPANPDLQAALKFTINVAQVN